MLHIIISDLLISFNGFLHIDFGQFFSNFTIFSLFSPYYAILFQSYTEYLFFALNKYKYTL